MKKVAHISDFPKGSYTTNFLGKGYDDAIKQAKDWQERTGNRIHSYYEQKLITKTHSILVSFERKT